MKDGQIYKQHLDRMVIITTQWQDELCSCWGQTCVSVCPTNWHKERHSLIIVSLWRQSFRETRLGSQLADMSKATQQAGDRLMSSKVTPVKIGHDSVLPTRKLIKKLSSSKGQSKWCKMHFIHRTSRAYRTYRDKALITGPNLTY